MKVDMSPAAVTRRLYQVDELRRLCLSLSLSSVGRQVAKECSNNPIVKRTAMALGDRSK